MLYVVLQRVPGLVGTTPQKVLPVLQRVPGLVGTTPQKVLPLPDNVQLFGQVGQPRKDDIIGLSQKQECCG